MAPNWDESAQGFEALSADRLLKRPLISDNDIRYLILAVTFEEFSGVVWRRLHNRGFVAHDGLEGGFESWNRIGRLVRLLTIFVITETG